MPKGIAKHSIINFLIVLLLLGVHILALFSSPTFLGSNYSRKALIDDYCTSNLNGSSVVFNATVANSSESLKRINNYRNSNDIEFNTVLGLGIDNVKLDGMDCSLVGSVNSKEYNRYNVFRVYSDDDWDLLNKSNSIFISDSMGISLVPPGKDPKNYKVYVKNKIVDIKIMDTVYSFKIAGFYNTTIVDNGWRSRGKYFDEAFSECVFVSEAFLSDKFTNVFQMITSDTIESGTTFERYESLIKSIDGKILTPNNEKEAEVLTKIDALNNKTNISMRTATIAVTLIVSLASLILSICLFDVKLLEKRKWLMMLWCLIYLLISYGFVFITKGVWISIFGFNAVGANRVSITIMSIYTFLLLVGIIIKFFWHSKITNKNKIVRYDI